MALKTFINGVLKNLTPIGKPPVVFINGEKKYLVKGVTFINGVKKVLWDTRKLQIDYIDTTKVGITGYTVGSATAFLATKNFVFGCGGYDLTRFNVTNPANPSISGQVANGYVWSYSSLDSTDSSAVFYAKNVVSSSMTFNQININLSSGAVSASNSVSYNIPSISSLAAIATNVGCLGWMNSVWVNANTPTNSARKINVRNGLTNLYSYQCLNPDTSTSYSGSLLGCPNFTKLDANTFVGRLSIYNGTTGIGEFNTSGYTAKSGSLDYQDFLADGNVIACAGASGFGLYNRVTSGSYTAIATASASGNRYMRLIGKCRDNYYVLEASGASGVSHRLKVFDSTGTLVSTTELSLGYNQRFNVAQAFVPTISETGYLCFLGDNNKIVRIQCY